MCRYVFQIALVLVWSLFLAESGLGSAWAATEEQSTCEDLEDCLTKLETWKLRDNYYGYFRNEIRQIGAALAQYGPEAVDRLIALLDHKIEEVRDRAGMALGYQETIHKRHLDALIKAHGNRVRNLPLPIMLTRQPEAVEYLLGQMRKDVEEGFTGISDAMARFPELTAVPMAEALSCELPCPENMAIDIFFAFRFMDVVPMDVVPIFIRHLNDSSIPEHATASTIAIVGEMGERAGPITPDLVRLSWAEGRIGWAATGALLDLQHPSGIQPALKLMRKHGAREGFIEKIVDLGPIAKQAAPTFTELLSHHSPWEDDFFYAWALGAIGYLPAVPVLASALDSPDWLVGYYAVEALSRLEAYQYRDRLIQMTETHYAAPVRSAATRNAAAMALKIYPPEGVYEENKTHINTNILVADETQCGPGRLDLSGPIPRLRVEDKDERLEKEMLKIDSLPDGVPEIEGVRGPSAALKVRGGWLIGTDRGEWGGKLYFVDRKGKAEVLYDRNVFDIWRDRKGHIYFTTGVDHLMYSPGKVWRLIRKKPRGYKAELVLRLTDGPDQTIRARGDLVVIASDLSAVGLKGGKPVRVDCVLQNSPD